MSDNYCLFHKNNKLHHGWIKQIKNNRFVVVPLQGSEFLCPVNQTEYSWKGKSFTNNFDAIKHLESKIEWVDQKVSSIDLELIHNLCEKDRTYTIDELSDLFLDHPEDGWERVALLKKVRSTKRLFQQKKGVFVPRKDEEVQAFDEKVRNEKLEQNRKEIEKEWLSSIHHNYSPEVKEEDHEFWNSFQIRFKEFLLSPETHPEKKFFKENLPPIDYESLEFEQLAVKYLKFMRTPISWANFIIKKSGVNDSYPEKLKNDLNRLKSLYELELQKEDRINLSELKTYTVDGELTEDYDDAISIEKEDDAIKVYVHIADVASFVEEGTPAFDECARRITSVYTLKKNYPMLPSELSEGLFSLGSGNKKCALSYIFTFDEEYRLISTEVKKSVIDIDQNLSYQEFDLMVEDETSIWATLFQIAQVQKDLRINNGGLDIKREDVSLNIENPEKIKIHKYDNSTPSYVIIQELSLMVNYYSAKFCIQNQLKCVFRGQDDYEISGKNHNMMQLTMADIKIKPAKVSLSPIKHHGLGLDFYTQTSSPIRRFLDLISQKIILSKINGSPIHYPEEQLYYWSERSDQQARAYSALEKNIIIHWKYKYLAQNKHRPFEVRIIKAIKGEKSLVSFDEIQLITETYLPGYKARERVHVLLEEVDIKLHRLVITKR